MEFPLQIVNGVDGFLVNDINEAAEKTLHLLKHRKEAEQMGAKGKEHVRYNSLIIDDLRDHLRLMTKLLTP